MLLDVVRLGAECFTVFDVMLRLVFASLIVIMINDVTMCCWFIKSFFIANDELVHNVLIVVKRIDDTTK